MATVQCNTQSGSAIFSSGGSHNGLRRVFLLPELLLSRPLNLSNLIPDGVLLWTLSFLGLLVFLLYILWNKVYAIRDLALNRLSFVSGQPYFSTQKRGNARLLKIEATLNTLRLGGSVEFIVPEELEDMLDKRRYYRLYHLTRSRIILSIEEISETH